MRARCKECGTKMILIEIDDRQQWKWETYFCPKCERQVINKFDKEEVEL